MRDRTMTVEARMEDVFPLKPEKPVRDGNPNPIINDEVCSFVVAVLILVLFVCRGASCHAPCDPS